MQTLGGKGVAISLASHEHASHVAHILSLTSGQRRDPANSQATAALFVRPVISASPSSLELLARSFQLTASEVRVLGAVMATGSLNDLANRLGITKATVKTHLNHLFAKTGTRRQSELIRLAAEYASPFA
jgi:DNA-binding CsgD family transcriptional regulator